MLGQDDTFIKSPEITIDPFESPPTVSEGAGIAVKIGLVLVGGMVLLGLVGKKRRKRAKSRR